MNSVTQRINKVSQPRGGYINPKQFSVTPLQDGADLIPEENIHSSLVGLAVDYLTRFVGGVPAQEAFSISLQGASLIGELQQAKQMLAKITGLDDSSILNACKLVGYDVCRRAGATGYRPVDEITPNPATISNISTMVNRCQHFLQKYGPVTSEGFTFEGGYTSLISSGDGDYLTADTLWELKVIKGAPTNKHTLQLLVYYLLGVHSIHEEFSDITRLGIFNPRTNNVYLLEIASIPSDTIQEVSSTVIGY